MNREQPSITCPQCGMTSHNANDVAQAYCGNCNAFHADMERCHCGQPLHYSNRQIRLWVEDLIVREGPTVILMHRESGRRFAVPRHYMALHCGPTNDELPTLGFEEVT